MTAKEFLKQAYRLNELINVNYIIKLAKNSNLKIHRFVHFLLYNIFKKTIGEILCVGMWLIK